MSTNNERVFSTIRVNKDAAVAIEKEAKKNRRSLSAQIALILETWADDK